MIKPDVELKDLSGQIALLANGHEPRMFLSALAVAAGVIIKNCVPKNKRRDAAAGVHASIVELMETR